MSIISGNRFDRRERRHHNFTDANMRAALTQPSKRDLYAMLAEAARNTAALSTDNQSAAHELSASVASAPTIAPGPRADAPLSREDGA